MESCSIKYLFFLIGNQKEVTKQSGRGPKPSIKYRFTLFLPMLEHREGVREAVITYV